MMTFEQHNEEIRRNLSHWRRKPILRRIYSGFHQLIAGALSGAPEGTVMELGSGVPDISEVIPACIRSDAFPNPWIDRVENAYALSFPEESLGALILFDVFHHLRYPGTALEEFHRVLAPRGRVVIFEPCVSLLGRIVYGPLHPEPLGLRQPLAWYAPGDWSPDRLDYYAAQGNASRIFLRREVDVAPLGWRVLTMRRFSALAYVLSGGYSRPQMYPDWSLPGLQMIERLCDRLPWLFATRLMVVLEKELPVEQESLAGPGEDEQLPRSGDDETPARPVAFD